MSLDIYLLDPPDKCPHCGGTLGTGSEVFWKNYTHNGIPMWEKAGVCDALYESNGHLAKEYIDVLKRGVEHFEANYPEYEKLNSPNGWGLAKHALPWLKEVARAFEEHPEATIRVSR